MPTNTFITGITGCLGHYLFDQLAADPERRLFLLMPNPVRLRRELKAYPNVTAVTGTMEKIGAQAELLRQTDQLVHLAAGWGVGQVNYEHTRELFSLLDPKRCRKVVYFSTASILGPDNRPVPEVAGLGNCYISSKYRMHRELPSSPVYDRTVTLFPTWVLGGDKDHPYSHATQGVLGAVKRLWLLRFLTFDLKFHYIHAQDIARITKYLLEHESAEKEYVLGNALITADQLIGQICDYFGQKRYFKFNLSRRLVNGVVRLLGDRVNRWDRYCLNRREFIHQVSDAASFGLASDHQTIPQLLADLGFKK